VPHKKFAAQSAAWSAAESAAWSAAWSAAESAARWAAESAARWAAWSAALQCLMTTVCADLQIAEPHRQNAADFWGIWRAGFGCMGKVGDEYYVYERP
jgi:hypothetical protein